jgi:glucosyl-3-phosphoglycerate synthase
MRRGHGRIRNVRRTYRSVDFPAARVLAAKRGRRISVCIPARNEEETIAGIVSTIRRDLMEAVPVVDEILVVDDGSEDRTAEVAAAEGAIVHRGEGVLADHPSGGKGQAMWRGVHLSTGDLVVFCDGDVRDFDAGFVLGLAGPLLSRDDVAFCKGFYERPGGAEGAGGGRVTELAARPLISVFFPHLADLVQPLSGECAARREILESVPFLGGYGVDLGLLIDVTAAFGNASLVQCDLGRRVHRNRPLHELSPQALAVLEVVLARAGVDAFDPSWPVHLSPPGAPPVEVRFEELPPLRSIPRSRKTA